MGSSVVTSVYVLNFTAFIIYHDIIWIEESPAQMCNGYF